MVTANLTGICRILSAGRVGKADEVTACICFLASHMAPFVVGAAWSKDGGLTAFGY
ncbi:MAG: SDR family oxidoreductase [Deltaproteobacteria bacterium]|nr:SDR family oxidoreductase [Deltaproteobacteria bacterium]